MTEKRVYITKEYLLTLICLKSNVFICRIQFHQISTRNLLLNGKNHLVNSWKSCNWYGNFKTINSIIVLLQNCSSGVWNSKSRHYFFFYRFKFAVYRIKNLSKIFNRFFSKAVNTSSQLPKSQNFYLNLLIQMYCKLK